MFNGWESFFLMAGGAAAVLIGLIFVVISLMGDRPRSTVLSGSRLYMGPIVLGVSFILTLCAAALTPGVTPPVFAGIQILVAIWGFIRAVNSSLGIRRLERGGEHVHWTDLWFYGLLPVALYLLAVLVGLAFWRDWPWARHGLGFEITAGLLLAIRNEWDLITWITPRGRLPGED